MLGPQTHTTINKQGEEVEVAGREGVGEGEEGVPEGRKVGEEVGGGLGEGVGEDGRGLGGEQGEATRGVGRKAGCERRVQVEGQRLNFLGRWRFIGSPADGS